MQPPGDREIIIALVAGSLMLLLLGGFILTFIFYYKKKRVVHFQEKKVMTENFQKEILKAQLEIQEQTLKNISQEIHDNIGQTLSLAKLNLNTIDHAKQNADQKILNSKELVSKAIMDLRSLSKTLNTDSILASGLRNAIEFELHQLDKGGAFKTQLKITGTPEKLNPQKELILFRIVQEALNNIIKHSEADSVTIQMNYSDHTVVVSVCDNGKGFTEKNNQNILQQGSGIQNMKSRAALIGGVCKIESSAEGTSVHIKVPVK